MLGAVDSRIGAAERVAGATFPLDLVLAIPYPQIDDMAE